MPSLQKLIHFLLPKIPPHLSGDTRQTKVQDPVQDQDTCIVARYYVHNLWVCPVRVDSYLLRVGVELLFKEFSRHHSERAHAYGPQRAHPLWAPGDTREQRSKGEYKAMISSCFCTWNISSRFHITLIELIVIASGGCWTFLTKILSTHREWASPPSGP